MPLRVLIVDDSETVRAVVADALEGLGHELVEAADGEEALLLAHLHRPDVVLMDVHMPRMDGLTAMARMAADPLLSDTPVVMLTQQDSPDAVATALDAGAYDFLGKPFEPVELRARVAAAGRTGQLVTQLRRLNRELDRVASTDPLTGLSNRRAVDDSMRTSGEGPMTVLLLDIDHFKEVNDTHGHDIGDAVLRMTASRLRNALRKADAVGRWGGEEFVALLPGADEGAARRACDRILESVRAPMSLAVGPLSVTVSIGVAIRRGVGERSDTSIDELLKRADMALYRAKQEGRDRIALA